MLSRKEESYTENELKVFEVIIIKINYYCKHATNAGIILKMFKLFQYRFIKHTGELFLLQ